MIRLIIASFCFVLIQFNSDAQKRCAVPAMMGRVPASDAQLKELSNLKKSNEQGSFRITEIHEVIRIPVVVHVIHDNVEGEIGGADNTNISNEQIFSQIKVLNEDFRRQTGTPGFNTNPVGADMEIEFYLATIDPDGNPTSGITRNFNSKRQWDIIRERSQIANIVSWDSNRYLNIWVLNLSATYLGYAEFPGAPVDGLNLNDPNEATDGVFIDYNFFGRQLGTAIDGPYTFGRTTTHEVGHWLGLIHIWGDSRCGSDFCEDTPEVERENLAVTCEPYFSRCTGTSVRAMIENYMDYTADECMNIFTQDQKTRVRQVLELSKRRRRLVLNSESFLPQVESLQVKLINHPNSKDKLSMQVLLQGFQDFNVNFYDVLGHLVDQKTFKDYPSTVVSFEEFKRLKPGQVYILRVDSQNVFLTFRVLIL